jgi:heavy metal sensor kinase
MNPRSLRFRLLAWFAGLLVLVVVLFGFYTYRHIESFVVEVQRSALAHRAQQIAAMLEAAPKGNDSAVGGQIAARFAPELNDKFVRVTRPGGSVLYVSGVPNDHSFDPAAVPAFPPALVARGRWRYPASPHGDLLLTALPVTTGAGVYLVEVGASLGGSYRLLRALLLTLAAGLPIVLILAIAGGYVVIWRALRPVQNMMSAAQDITLHHLSRRLPVPASGDEIASLASALNQMIARLDESFQNTSRFTADASHELRTPLTIVRGELEALLLPGDLPQHVHDTLASLLEEIERLVRIVEGLFALARLDTGEAQKERVRFNLAGLAETTAEQMCLLAEEKQISLVCETREPIEVEGDRARLKQVIVNLLDNAIKYTGRDGEIRLSVRAQNGTATLEIRDNGPGAPEAALPHLFERFYRAESVRDGQTSGAGLGLSIVHSICTAHGGSVSVRNHAGSGFQVTVTLPRAL